MPYFPLVGQVGEAEVGSMRRRVGSRQVGGQFVFIFITPELRTRGLGA